MVHLPLLAVLVMVKQQFVLAEHHFAFSDA
jgi:hypothetical protein